MKLRGALLGAGNIALRGHVPQWLGDERLRDEVEIVAIADLSHQNLDLAQASFPSARAYDRIETSWNAKNSTSATSARRRRRTARW